MQHSIVATLRIDDAPSVDMLPFVEEGLRAVTQCELDLREDDLDGERVLLLTIPHINVSAEYDYRDVDRWFRRRLHDVLVLAEVGAVLDSYKITAICYPVCA